MHYFVGQEKRKQKKKSAIEKQKAGKKQRQEVEGNRQNPLQKAQRSL